VKANPNEPNIIIALDGNFQQLQYAYASKDNPPNSNYLHSFIPPANISANALSFATTEASAVGIDVSFEIIQIGGIKYKKSTIGNQSIIKNKINNGSSKVQDEEPG
jgi:hypothetical protein